MAPVQASAAYTIEHGAGFSGQVADQQNLEIMSGVAEGVVPIGIAVTRGSADGSVIVPSGTATFRGISVRSLDLEANAATAIEYVDGNEVAILTRGTIFVTANETVAPDEPVHFQHTGTGIGNFRNDTDTGDADLIVGATFLDDALVGELVRIRIPSAVA